MANERVLMWSATTLYAISTLSTSSVPTFPEYSGAPVAYKQTKKAEALKKYNLQNILSDRIYKITKEKWHQNIGAAILKDQKSNATQPRSTRLHTQ